MFLHRDRSAHRKLCVICGSLLLVGWSTNKAQAQLGATSAAPSTLTAVPLGPDRGYAYSHSRPNLLNISQLILRLTKRLVSLIARARGSGGDFDAMAVMQTYDELRDAARARRAMQAAEVYDEVVDELVREEAEATKAGREPTQQQAEEAADRAERTAAERPEIRLFDAPYQPATPPETKPATNPMPPVSPLASRSRQAVTEHLAFMLRIIDNPHDPRSPRTPPEAIEFLKQNKRDVAEYVEKNSNAETASEIRAAMNEVFDPVIAQMEANEQSGIAWIEAGARRIETLPTTPAELAETASVAQWREDDERLQLQLESAEWRSRDLERSLSRRPDWAPDYRAARADAAKAKQDLVNHRALDRSTYQRPAAGGGNP